jgi:hypothetical protein
MAEDTICMACLEAVSEVSTDPDTFVEHAEDCAHVLAFTEK